MEAEIKNDIIKTLIHIPSISYLSSLRNNEKKYQPIDD